MPQRLFPGWRNSPAYIFLLGAFLEPHKPAELTALVDWEIILGEAPQIVLMDFLASGELEYADEGEPLDARMADMLAHQLRELCRERGLPISGRKAELIARLIEADPAGMKEVNHKQRAVQCTERGRTAVEEFLLAGPQTGAVADTVASTEPEATTQPAKPTLRDRIGQPLGWLTARVRSDGSGAGPDGTEPVGAGAPGTSALDAAPAAGFVDVEAAKAHVERGRLLGEQGDYDRALTEFDEAIALNPRFALSYFWRAVIYERLGQYTQTLAEMNQAIALNPNPARFYALRGDAYRGLGEWTLAVREYDAALQRERLLLAYHNRGIAHEQMGDYVQALEDYDRAIELNPEAAEPYFGRGVAYEMIGDFERARDEFQVVLQLSSDASVLTQARERLQTVMGYI